MTWREDQARITLPDGKRVVGASFNRVPFYVESGERAGGRRAEVHEFPGRDDPFVDDTLGRRARTFAVEGYVLGLDYMRARDALIAAIEAPGPGELVHPYYGALVAVCTNYRVREAQRDGGIATFSLEFAEAPAQTAVPVVIQDRAAAVATAAEVAQAASLAELEAGYDATGLPSFAIASAAAALDTASAAVGAGLAPIAQGTQELAELDVAIRSLRGQATTLVRSPADTIGAFRGALGTVADTSAAVPGRVVTALIDAYGADLGPLAPATTATRLRERANQLAMTAALRRTLAIEAARLASVAAYETHDDALAARDAVLELLDEQAEVAGDAAYPALAQLRADLVAAVPGEAERARLVTIERRMPVPSILLSYQLYGSVEQEADLVARNRVRHPGLMAGELQALSDG